MRYAIFTDVHANLEALEAVLAKIDELAEQEPIDQIWFLGDLVGYGPNPNECIQKLRERTDVIIAGNHDWAAVGKIDLEDFSEAARISAEWTATQLTEEHRQFLQDLPERIEKEDCVLVHGSPYGPLWEYLTSEVLAERSFTCFNSRYCLVGHTHVPIIFQQPDALVTTPTIPLDISEQNRSATEEQADIEEQPSAEDETAELAAIRPVQQALKAAIQAEHAHITPDALQAVIADATDILAGAQQIKADDAPDLPKEDIIIEVVAEEPTATASSDLTPPTQEPPADEATQETSTEEVGETPKAEETPQEMPVPEPAAEQEVPIPQANTMDQKSANATTPEETIVSAEERLNEEIEELLALLGLSQSMVNVNNEMLVPPEGEWQAPDNYRAIVNPGGVGQPRDGDPRAAFMIYDTQRGFTFYRIPYEFEKTQEKVIKAGLPQYLAMRLAYGR